MPNKDQTGPNGDGPRTGRRFGQGKGLGKQGKNQPPRQNQGGRRGSGQK